MTGKFKLFTVNELFEYHQDPGQKDVPYWARKHSPHVKLVNLSGLTGIVIFGPTQEKHLSRFRENDIYKILFISNKCVNPNHRDSGPRNTIVIFEEK